MMINTGAPRSVSGHAISGGIIALIASGAYQYTKFQEGKITQQEAIKTTIKSTLEGSVITACSIAATNVIGDSSKTTTQKIALASTYIAIGGAFIYAAQNLFKPKECELLQNQQKRLKNDKQ